jgi:hypothetical protein
MAESYDDEKWILIKSVKKIFVSLNHRKIFGFANILQRGFRYNQMSIFHGHLFLDAIKFRNLGLLQISQKILQ